jgi:hypothetical protein
VLAALFAAAAVLAVQTAGDAYSSRPDRRTGHRPWHTGLPTPVVPGPTSTTSVTTPSSSASSSPAPSSAPASSTVAITTAPPPASPSPDSQSSVSQSAAAGLAPPIYGDTLDDAAFGDIRGAVAGSTIVNGFGRRLTHRIVVDPDTSPADYARAVNALLPSSNLMAGLADSSEVSKLSLADYTSRTKAWLASFGSKISMYEVGNEVNGEWLGTTSDVVNKIHASYSLVKQAGRPAALTTYYNPDCWSSPDHEMLPWLAANIPSDMKARLDEVFVSYYEGDCNGHRISESEWNSVVDRLHAMFPAARIGFGELGLSSPVSGTSLVQADSLMRWYYNLVPTSPDAARQYVRGGFWWYAQEDLYSVATLSGGSAPGGSLWQTFLSLIRSY